MLYSGRMLRERKKKLVEREKASMSAWALTAASYFICQIHVAKVTFAFVVVLFTKPLMTSIVDDKVPNWRDDVDDDDGACPALNHYTIDQLGQPCCIWSLCSRQWTVNCGCECGSWLQLRSPIDCYRVSLLSVVVCLSNSCWGASLGLFCYPFFLSRPCSISGGLQTYWRALKMSSNALLIALYSRTITIIINASNA